MVASEQLLRRYVEDGSEEAFSELVERHVNLVHAAALRQVGGNAELARDIVQTVFADLARKARVVGMMPVAGWLYRHTRFAAAKALRTECRRRTREREAIAMNGSDDSNSMWESLAPVLDEAMNALSSADRNALVLRFFEGNDLRTVGTVLGTNEDAAQKRIARALEKLRGLLDRRGVTLSTTTLGSLLAAQAMGAAPAGLATAIAGTSLLSAATASSSWVLGKLLFMTNVKAVSLGALLVAGIATPLVLQHNAISGLRRDNAALRQQLAAAPAAAETANVPDDTAQGEAQRLELMRLRGEAARWRIERQELARLQQENKRLQTTSRARSNPATTAQPQDYLPRESWADVGYATPQAALQTLGWSIGTGNIQRFKDSVLITAEARQFLTDMLAKMAPDALEQAAQRGWGVEEGLMFPMMAQDRKEGYKAFRIVTQDSPSHDEVVMQTELETNAGRTHQDRMRFKLVGDQWKRLLDIEDLPPAQDTRRQQR